MDFKTFNTGTDDISRRLDKVIRIFAPELPLSEIYKAIRKGFIKINHKKTKSDYRIQADDEISIASFLLENKDNEKKVIKNFTNQLQSLPEIIFENEYVLILNKPYDINVHGDNNSLDKLVLDYYNSKHSNNSLSFKPGPLHRLDKKTTGLIAFSMNLQGAHWFSENIQNHIIQKKYWGLAEGLLNSKETWIDKISTDDNTVNGFHTVKANNSIGVKAETLVTPIAYGKYKDKDVTLIEFFIKTGRKHQIRAQSAVHNHPLLGDTAYGGKKIIGSERFYLTAKELIFPDNNPLKLPKKLTVSLPEQFKNILKSCGIHKTDV